MIKMHGTNVKKRQLGSKRLNPLNVHGLPGRYQLCLILKRRSFHIFAYFYKINV